MKWIRMAKRYSQFLNFGLCFCVLLFFFISPVKAGSGSLPPAQEASPTPKRIPPSPSELIEVVNDLRISNGLNVLSVHSVLMDIAAQQASALAFSEGAIGHQRPCGMTLGQQMLVMGFPLWGDLSLDGYRSENWATALDIADVIQFWLSDDAHTNTMLSPNRSDIGAAISESIDGQFYFVLETALKTNSGQHQSTAYDILTGVPMTQTLCSGFVPGDTSQYTVPVVVSTARPDGDVVHEVQYGQTLWALSEMYHVSIEEIKRLNGLTDDNIAQGWKLLIQKAATQPVSVTDSPVDSGTPTLTSYPTAIPFNTTTPTTTPVLQPVSLEEEIGNNQPVLAALLIAFSVLLAGLMGFGKKVG